MNLFADVSQTAGNPALGVTIFMLGGLAGAVFYLPFKRVKNWAWESYWMIYAVAGLVIVPWALAFATSPNLVAVLRAVPGRELGWCFLCGAMWGVGGLTWGLMIRYLGVGFGVAIGAGLLSAAGTLVPTMLNGQFLQLFHSNAGQASLAAVAISLVGIALVGGAGMSKERELPEEEKKKAVAEFNFRRGIVVAIFSGLMSAGMSYGLQGGEVTEFKAQYGSETRVERVEKPDLKAPPPALAGVSKPQFDEKKMVWFVPAVPAGETLTSPTWKGMPVLVVVLLGGFAVNALWCLGLNLKNKTTGDYVKRGAPLVPNLLFAGLAGAVWCSQFVCFKTGEPCMGKLSYVGWAALMASMILCSTLLGIFLGEWKNTSNRTKTLLALGLIVLVISSVITGCSGYLKG